MQILFTGQASRYIPPLLIAVIFPFFFTGGPTLESSPLFGAVWDCGHIVFFCLLVIYLNRKITLRGPAAVITLTVLVFLTGGLIELIQMKVGRDGTWQDVFYDLAGTWIGLVWCQPVTRTIKYARVAILALSIPALSRIVLLALLQLQAAHEFPVIADFESQLELYQYQGVMERSGQYRTHGNFSLKLTLQTSNYSGINFARSYPDWAAYKFLRMDIYIPDSEPLDIVIRVNDVTHDMAGYIDDDRFNYSLRLHEGWNLVSLPINDIRTGPSRRQMDLSNISSIGIFATGLPVARVIYIDYLRLE